jgi:hypothetical protein
MSGNDSMSGQDYLASLLHQARQDMGSSDSMQQLSSHLHSVLDLSRLPDLEEPTSPALPSPLVTRLPLFSRCPFTNEAQLWGHENLASRAPLLALAQQGRDQARAGLTVRRPWSNSVQSTIPPTSKPSLDSFLCTSLVALTNKQGEGKYWFKSGCPTPDPRWPASQQLMIGPIPGDVEYSELRTAFLGRGHTCHLFIQNNQAWLERNQEKFGPRQVKFGYVVYSEADIAARLYRQGSLAVRRGAVGTQCQVKVKRMDGLPALFHRN